MIKLLAIDMDGTLLDEDKTLRPETIADLDKAREAGVLPVICTGRPLSGVLPYLKELGWEGKDGYMIINNGATIHSTKDLSIHSWSGLSEEELILLDKISQESTAQLTVFDERDYLVVGEDAGHLVTMDAGLVFSKPKRVELDQLLVNQDKIFQAMYLDEKDALDRFEEKYGVELAQHFEVVRSQEYIYECLPKGINKATGLSYLAQNLGFSNDQVMAIGDANNDLEMLAYAGWSVAMGNANEAVKKVAKFQTGSHTENGVGQAIREILLPAIQK
ncbi:Cof-type HAD-IIB family hydrolase [Streptococcus sp. NLN64]|uniref:Cof-type HAD-IIB family hydrolase n=1 Tax=Streptococcus sp. NLN64 TaxID=2822799 RepID=UPI0018C9C533|nr:Cof-type HAD-IIB family hydrolase [Streptococcus sp. NLN64]MBG9368137.1 HAD family phosphatase [Streptococcus sp. NLN64]